MVDRGIGQPSAKEDADGAGRARAGWRRRDGRCHSPHSRTGLDANREGVFLVVARRPVEQTTRRGPPETAGEDARTWASSPGGTILPCSRVKRPIRSEPIKKTNALLRRYRCLAGP